MTQVIRLSLVVLAVLFTATSFADIINVQEPIQCESGALDVEANAGNAATKKDLKRLHRILARSQKHFEVKLLVSTPPTIAYQVVQLNYDQNAAARRRWSRLQNRLLKVNTVKLSCGEPDSGGDEGKEEEEQEEQEEDDGGVTGGNLLKPQS